MVGTGNRAGAGLAAAWLGLSLGLAVALTAPAAQADTGRKSGYGGARVVTVAADLGFSATDRQIVSNFFLRNSGYYSSLPPGLRRQLVTKGRLPPGIARKALPPGLSNALPPAPRGYQRMIVGPDVLLVETATGIILDIIRDVVR
ncbi:RcnB family protein [Zavarzinia compransoris]|uniref:RcnB family protein n=1 Tax=Zavarzinia marina TaxID=2911065 RepID=UPI001F324517|nr:RcnB family protein [Zavarzinia marina]MCF4165836.1 RcnB family protein [Zavarzinia marina]